MLLWQITTTGGATVRAKDLRLGEENENFNERVEGVGLDDETFSIPRTAIAGISIIDFCFPINKPKVGFNTESNPKTP